MPTTVNTSAKKYPEISLDFMVSFNWRWKIGRTHVAISRDPWFSRKAFTSSMAANLFAKYPDLRVIHFHPASLDEKPLVEFYREDF